MSDWNTIYLFDVDKFYKKIVPQLIEDKGYIIDFINSKPYSNWYSEKITDNEIDSTIDFFQSLTTDFKSNKVLLEILKSEKKEYQLYADFNSIKNSRIKDFYEVNGKIIEVINQFLPYLIYEECVYREPHLSIGRSILTSKIVIKSNSLIEEIMMSIYKEEIGSTHRLFGSGIMNWLTLEQVNILLLDVDNLKAKTSDSEDYKNDFIKILSLTYEQKLGIITLSNLQENLLDEIENKVQRTQRDL
ncbi:hypothetical protein [Cellulophaga sp. L1A9]|uniref:hypothetical protein n=1 Tax=Cellulophaga sp. L1A9 TaxID=2686362 RepID=UPI00131E4A4C|nr:hypothetical protein [Cellulophaga sp. L1A9]